MIKAFISIAVYLASVLSCYYSSAQEYLVRTAYETKLPGSAYYGKGKINTQKTGYLKYDSSNNIIEEGSFVHSLYGRGFWNNYGDTNEVTFRHFSPENKLIEAVNWQYVSGKKKYIIRTDHYEYNASGKLYRVTSFDTKGNLSSSRTYKYDSGSMISVDSVYNFWNGNGYANSEAGRDTTLLDSMGRTVEELHYSGGKLVTRYQYVYDKFTVDRTILRYDSNPDTLFSVAVKHYGRDEKILSYSEIIIEWPQEQSELYYYDRSGRLQSVESFLFGSRAGVTKYVYRVLRY